MNDFPTNVKQKLNSIIKDMADHHWLFTKHPGRDFSRQHLGKLSFYDKGVFIPVSNMPKLEPQIAPQKGA